VFDKYGHAIYWHTPPDRTAGSIPDSRPLWDVLWENRTNLGGFIHTHPWWGEAYYSQEDVTTFAAIEDGLGQRLVWPVATFTEVKYFVWVGPGRFDYAEMGTRRFRLLYQEIEELRQLSLPTGKEDADGKSERDVQGQERGVPG
jgi:hypothetical protein